MQKISLSHGDYTKIAHFSGLSLSTIQKYFSNDSQLTVKPETELKILEGLEHYLKSESAGMEKFLQKVLLLQNRSSLLYDITNAALLDLKNALLSSAKTSTNA